MCVLAQGGETHLDVTLPFIRVPSEDPFSDQPVCVGNYVPLAALPVDDEEEEEGTAEGWTNPLAVSSRRGVSACVSVVILSVCLSACLPACLAVFVFFPCLFEGK